MYNWNYNLNRNLGVILLIFAFFSFKVLYFSVKKVIIFPFKNLATNITWVESEIHDDAPKKLLLILHKAYNM
jgi:hypothetical protein